MSPSCSVPIPGDTTVVRLLCALPKLWWHIHQYGQIHTQRDFIHTLTFYAHCSQSYFVSLNISWGFSLLTSKEMIFNSCIVFLWMNYHNLFDESPVNGNLGCFQSVAMSDLG